MESKLKEVREHWIKVFNEKNEKFCNKDTDCYETGVLSLELDLIEQFIKDLDTIG